MFTTGIPIHKSSFLILLSLKNKLLTGVLSRKKQTNKNKQKYYSGETIHLKIINIWLINKRKFIMRNIYK
ncbi:TPA: hypothetical protein HNC63_06035 [Escherichia fergusonii]|nr:hypothetical protein DKG79_15190 [Escherichia fergusonii]HAJ6529301.1 hypothetical protein [Escherichia fergusonii]HAJ6558983.1 hypothetical protein [Escherichia fergusonii]HAJ6568752.1 hypothetical protein [Escherichia fergusonii]